MRRSVPPNPRTLGYGTRFSVSYFYNYGTRWLRGVTLFRVNTRWLPHRDGQAAQIGVSHQPDLPAREFQNSTFLVDKYNAADANAERKTRAGCAVDTGNIRRPPDVTNAAPQHGPRSAEQEPVVYPSNRERIEAAMKVEHAVASRAADDPT